MLSKYNFNAAQIYNMDESGLSTVPNYTPKVISEKGKRMVAKVSSAERGELVTTICCFNALGNYIPPGLIFPRKRLNENFKRNAPTNTVVYCCESGYINTEIFVEWLHHFAQYANSSEKNQILLILDNHSSHISLQAALFCRENYIHLLTIPPHASHKLQPLDKSFFDPLKIHFGAVVDQWLVNHPGECVTLAYMAELFRDAYLETASVEAATAGFEKCGIYPFNRRVLKKRDFLPSMVTDQNQTNSRNTDSIPNDNEDDGNWWDDSGDEGEAAAIENVDPTADQPQQVLSLYENPTPGSSKMSDENLFENATTAQRDPVQPETGSGIVSANLVTPHGDGTGDGNRQSSVSPRDIIPLPRIQVHT